MSTYGCKCCGALTVAEQMPRRCEKCTGRWLVKDERINRICMDVLDAAMALDTKAAEDITVGYRRSSYSYVNYLEVYTLNPDLFERVSLDGDPDRVREQLYALIDRISALGETPYVSAVDPDDTYHDYEGLS